MPNNLKDKPSLDRKRKWYLNNKSKTHFSNKKWRERNPDKIVMYKSSLKVRLMNTKSNAKRDDREWNLHLESFVDRPLTCHYTGFKLTLKPGCMNTLSFDRIDNSKGYIDDNVVFCCDMVNFMKSNMKLACFKAICKAVGKKS